MVHTLLPSHIIFCSPAHQSFFWYDNDKDLKACFAITRLICTQAKVIEWGALLYVTSYLTYLTTVSLSSRVFSDMKGFGSELPSLAGETFPLMLIFRHELQFSDFFQSFWSLSITTLYYCYGAVVPGCWVVPGLLCASGSAIPPVCVGVRALLSLSSGTPLGLLKVSSRFIVVWIIWAVWLSLVVFSLLGEVHC